MAQANIDSAARNGSGINQKVANAKAALAKSNRDFPSGMAPRNRISSVPAKATPSLADQAESEGRDVASGLRWNARQVHDYNAAAPKMHTGGPVREDGVYSLKAGEHVLTAREASKAKRHALMAAGMKSLAQPRQATAGEPSAIAAHDPAGMSKVRPEGAVSNDQGQMKRTTMGAAGASKGKPKMPSVRPVNADSKIRPSKSPAVIRSSKMAAAGSSKGKPNELPPVKSGKSTSIIKASAKSGQLD